MKNLIIERLIKSVLLIGTSIVLIIISVVFFIMFFSDVEARSFCIVGFIFGLILLVIGVFSYKNVKHLKEQQSKKLWQIILGSYKMDFIKVSNMPSINMSNGQEQFVTSLTKANSLLLNSNSYGYLIKDGDLTIGFILLIKFEEKSLYIQDLRISKLYQNKGYGTKIIKELIINSKMLSITKLTVTCKSDNHEGFKFFTKFDFVKDIEEDSDEFNYHLYL